MINEICLTDIALLEPDMFVAWSKEDSVNRRANKNSIKVLCMFTEEMSFISILRRKSVEHLCYNWFCLISSTWSVAASVWRCHADSVDNIWP